MTLLCLVWIVFLYMLSLFCRTRNPRLIIRKFSSSSIFCLICFETPTSSTRSAPCYPKIFKLEYLLSHLLWNSRLFNLRRTLLSRNFQAWVSFVSPALKLPPLQPCYPEISTRAKTPSSSEIGPAAQTREIPLLPLSQKCWLDVAVSKPVGVRW